VAVFINAAAVATAAAIRAGVGILSGFLVLIEPKCCIGGFFVDKKKLKRIGVVECSTSKSD
jgi:hypothetical protein